MLTRKLVLLSAVRGQQRQNLRRSFSQSVRVDASAKYTTSLNIFDRETKRKQKNFTCSNADFKQFEYVKEEVGYRMVDRVFDIKRTFDKVLDLGCQRGYVSRHLTNVSLSLSRIHAKSGLVKYLAIWPRKIDGK